MPRVSLPSFHSSVKVVARAMSGIAARLPDLRADATVTYKRQLPPAGRQLPCRQSVTCYFSCCLRQRIPASRKPSISPSSTASRVADLELRAQVLDHLVRVQDVRTHLVAPGVAAVALEGVHLGLLLLAAPLEQLGLEDVHRGRLVLDLRALVLAGDDDAGREVGEAHRGVGGVDALAAGAGGRGRRRRAARTRRSRRGRSARRPAAPRRPRRRSGGGPGCRTARCARGGGCPARRRACRRRTATCTAKVVDLMPASSAYEVS